MLWRAEAGRRLPRAGQPREPGVRAGHHGAPALPRGATARHHLTASPRPCPNSRHTKGGTRLASGRATADPVLGIVSSPSTSLHGIHNMVLQPAKGSQIRSSGHANVLGIVCGAAGVAPVRQQPAFGAGRAGGAGRHGQGRAGAAGLWAAAPGAGRAAGAPRPARRRQAGAAHLPTHPLPASLPCTLAAASRHSRARPPRAAPARPRVSLHQAAATHKGTGATRTIAGAALPRASTIRDLCSW